MKLLARDDIGLLVDSDIDLSTRHGITRVLVNKTLSTFTTETTYQQDVINRDRLSTWLTVGKLVQTDMRCVRTCKSTSNVLVCETQGKVCICMDTSVSE